jgi:hypothetical protein
MLLVCTVCLGLVLGPSYAIFGVVALVAFIGVWALVEDFHKNKEQYAADRRSAPGSAPRRVWLALGGRTWTERESDEFGTASFE